MPDRCYCNVREVKGWGVRDEADLLSFIRAASDWISLNIGDFIPVTDTKEFDGTGSLDLWVPPLLAITTITDDGDTLASTDYLLYPLNRWWENGPYTRMRVDPDASNLSAWTWEEQSVQIAGRWGYYEENKATGATVANTTQISAAGTSLIVSNGSLVAPGDVLLIESEQLLVTATEAPTDSTTNTAEALDASEEEVTVDDGTKVYAGEVIRVDYEQMYVRSIKGNDLVVERGFHGTAKTTHTTSADVYAYRTYTVKRGVNGTTAAAHLNGVAISKYYPPWDVRYLCKQMASLMAKKEETGYAGKTGSVELGEVFYHQEFPKEVLANIRSEYGKAKRHGG